MSWEQWRRSRVPRPPPKISHLLGKVALKPKVRSHAFQLVLLNALDDIDGLLRVGRWAIAKREKRRAGESWDAQKVVIPRHSVLRTLKIFSGEEAATASMSTPPSGLPTRTGPRDSRSMRIAKYVSRSMSSASATITCVKK